MLADLFQLLLQPAYTDFDTPKFLLSVLFQKIVSKMVFVLFFFAKSLSEELFELRESLNIDGIYKNTAPEAKHSRLASSFFLKYIPSSLMFQRETWADDR